MAENRIHVWLQKFKDRPHLVLQWHDPDDGRRKSKSAGTADPDLAEQARADHESDLNHGRYVEAARISWKDFRERFEEEYVAARRESSQERYARALDRFEKHGAPKKVRQITARTLTKYAAKLRQLPGRKPGSKMSAVTVAYDLKVLQIALRWAEGQGYLTKAPEFPDVPAPVKLPPAIPAETVERLLTAAKDDKQLLAFLLCGWLAGLRIGEAVALQWEPSDSAPWLDFSRKRIWLPATAVKAGRDQWLPLDADLAAALRSLPRTGRKVFRFTKASGAPLKRAGLGGRVARLAAKAGVRLSMKSLRKAFGSWYAARVSAHVLQKLMRHANIATTMAYYANIDDAVEAAILERNKPRSSGLTSGSVISEGASQNVNAGSDLHRTPDADL